MLLAVDEIPDGIGVEYRAPRHAGVVCVGKETGTVRYAATEPPEILRVYAHEDGLHKYKGHFVKRELRVRPVHPADHPVFREGDQPLELVDGQNRLRNHLAVFCAAVETQLQRGDAQFVQFVVRKRRPVATPLIPEHIGRTLQSGAAFVIVEIDQFREAVIRRDCLRELVF